MTRSKPSPRASECLLATPSSAITPTTLLPKPSATHVWTTMAQPGPKQTASRTTTAQTVSVPKYSSLRAGMARISTRMTTSHTWPTQCLALTTMVSALTVTLCIPYRSFLKSSSRQTSSRICGGITSSLLSGPWAILLDTGSTVTL